MDGRSSGEDTAPAALSAAWRSQRVDGRGAFIVTIDTEGDDLWSRPTRIATENARTLPRFHELCERYGLRPTYLTNWEMANSDAFVEFGRSVLETGSGEIGMHLHAWNSPPLVPLTEDDLRHQPFLIEYPEDVIREKVEVMTDTLESTFGVKMVSHRAGRWALDETYVRILIDAGYRVDCSVTPDKDWTSTRGSPTGRGGSDYRGYPDVAYFMDPDSIGRPGTSVLLQVPLTIVPIYPSAWARTLRASFGRIPYVRRSVYRSVPARSWLQPAGNTGDQLARIIAVASKERRDHIEFVIHSSELMAGGSPWFRTEDRIEKLYEDLERLFAASTTDWVGSTLSEYHAAVSSDAQAERTPEPADRREPSVRPRPV